MKTRWFIVLLVLFFVYRLWFSFSGTLSSGDWPYLYLENIAEFSWSLDTRFLWLAPYYQILSKILVQYIGISWELVEKLFWFWPFIVLSIVSSYYLTKSWIGVLIYTTNTYVLMLVGGGQMGIALAYAITPFVLARFIKVIQNSSIRQAQDRIQNSIFAGLILAIQMMLDPRITYVTIIAIVIYALFNFRKVHTPRLILHTFVVPIAIALSLSFYWIIPVLKHGLPKGVGTFGNLVSFEFLSFADFSNTISLLHPNWPENIFGKTYFLQPEFIILPVIAYSSLLFISNIKISNIKNQNSPRVASFPPRGWNSFTPREILFFSLLGLLGAFLAKGINGPFGEINQFIFQYVPGMSMFRDPSKFYLLVALAYSVLIPFSVHSIYNWLISNIKYQKFNFSYVFLIFTILYFIFLIRPAILGQLGGTFKTYQIPQEYIALKEFLKADPSFAPVLWVPDRQRFGFYSNNHPALSAPSATATFLKERKIKYVIIPFDSQKELFLVDRKYSKSMRDRIEKDLDTLQPLVKKKGFGNITVYEIQ